MQLNYQHDKIVVDQPAPGHFVIKGHQPKNVPTEEGTVVPMDTVYITPEVPSDLLFAILEARGEFQQTGAVQIDTSAQDAEDYANELEVANGIAEGLRVQLEEARAEQGRLQANLREAVAEIEALKNGPAIEKLREAEIEKARNKGGRPKKVQPSAEVIE